MQIIELFGKASTLRYTYRIRGTEDLFLPNYHKEEAAGPWFTAEDGRLFSGQPIGFDGYSILNAGIDLVLDLGGRYFLDHLTLKLAVNSVLDGIDVLGEDGRLVGRVTARECAADGELVLGLGLFAERLTLRFAGAYRFFGVASISLPAAAGLEDTVYPLPTDASYGDGILPFSALTGITAEQPAKGAATYLAERLSSDLSLPAAATAPGGNIRLTYATREDDGYTLSVTAEGVCITAAYPRAFFYAAATLMQLATAEGFRLAKIDDTPMMELRGVHIPLPNRDEIPFLFRLFRELIVPMRYNTVIIQLSGTMHYDCFPRINEMWLEAGRRYEKGEWPKPAHYGFVGHDILSHEEIRKICAYIRSFGLEIVPEVQTLSHVQYLTTAFPELAEKKPLTEAEDIDHETADIAPSDFYSHNACPRHPKYYDYVLPIIDEVIEVLRPERFLHIGHDEGYDIGTCPRCRGHATEIFVEEVTRLHDHIAAKGLTTMMWSDMLHPGAQAYHVPDSAALLPRDIIMLDFTWYFELPVDIEDRLLPHGYRLMIGNLYSSHYPRYETRSKKPGIIGGQVSTWCANREEVLAHKGKMYDLVYTATMMWNPDYREDCRLTYTELTKRLLVGMRRRIGLIPREAATEPIPLGGRAEDVPTELLFHSPATEALRLSPNRSEVTVPVGRRATLLEILHATDRASHRPIWDPPVTIGEYVLLYADGSEHTVPINYSENILTYRHRYGTPIPSPYYRHYGYTGTYSCFPIEGKDSEGRDYTLFCLPVVNPHPEREIRALTVRHAGNTDAEILVFDVKADGEKPTL